MADGTRIAWTDATINPVVGCSHEGCAARCYAAPMAARLARMGQERYQGLTDERGRWTGTTCFVASELDKPRHWARHRRIFVCSMGDLFHATVADDSIARVFDMARECQRHTFLVLTKRSARARDALPRLRFDGWANNGDGRTWVTPKAGTRDGWALMGGLPGCHPLHNVHLGVSVNSAADLHRVDDLRETPAAVRWISAEPLLGPLEGMDLRGIGWVVVGCESGPKRRRCAAIWMEDIVQQCKVAGVPCYVKQVDVDGRVSHEPAEWRESLRVREYPQPAASRRDDGR